MDHGHLPAAARGLTLPTAALAGAVSGDTVLLLGGLERAAVDTELVTVPARPGFRIGMPLLARVAPALVDTYRTNLFTLPRA